MVVKVAGRQFLLEDVIGDDSIKNAIHLINREEKEIVGEVIYDVNGKKGKTAVFKLDKIISKERIHSLKRRRRKDSRKKFGYDKIVSRYVCTSIGS